MKMHDVWIGNVLMVRAPVVYSVSLGRIDRQRRYSYRMGRIGQGWKGGKRKEGMGRECTLLLSHSLAPVAHHLMRNAGPEVKAGFT